MLVITNENVRTCGKRFNAALAKVLARPTSTARISGLQLIALKCIPQSPMQLYVVELLKKEGYGK